MPPAEERSLQLLRVRLLDGHEVVADLTDDVGKSPCPAACVPTHEGQVRRCLRVGNTDVLAAAARSRRVGDGLKYLY